MTQSTPPGWYPDPSGAPGRRYFDGQNWTDQRAANQQPQVMYVAAPKKRPVWPWVLGGIFLVILLGFTACVAFVGSVANEVSKDFPVTSDAPSGQAQRSESASPPADTGADFPGKQSNDFGLNAGGSATSDGVTITSSPLTPKNQFGDTYLCTQVTMQNNSGKQATFNTLFDWKMQDPSGTTKDASVVGADNFLGAGEIAPGGTAKGDICFESPTGNPSGTYVVLFDPTIRLSSNRIGWINQL
jgi:hypothetical protein